MASWQLRLAAPLGQTTDVRWGSGRMIIAGESQKKYLTYSPLREETAGILGRVLGYVGMCDPYRQHSGLAHTTRKRDFLVRNMGQKLRL